MGGFHPFPPHSLSKYAKCSDIKRSQDLTEHRKDRQARAEIPSHNERNVFLLSAYL